LDSSSSITIRKHNYSKKFSILKKTRVYGKNCGKKMFGRKNVSCTKREWQIRHLLKVWVERTRFMLKWIPNYKQFRRKKMALLIA